MLTKTNDAEKERVIYNENACILKQRIVHNVIRQHLSSWHKMVSTSGSWTSHGSATRYRSEMEMQVS